VTVGTGGTAQALTFGSGLTGGAYTSFNGSIAVSVTVDPTVTATLTGTQTLTNKTISGASNTITGLQNTALAYPYFTINGTQFQLGSSITVSSSVSTLTLGTGLTGTSFNGSTAVTTNVDNTVVAFLSGAQTLTNKTINQSNIGVSSPGTGAFTTLSATGQITSTLADGTAPFVITSTTNVPNLNASSINGATFAAPGAIGGTTASAGAFTTITATTSVTVAGNLVISRGAGNQTSNLAIGASNPLGANTGSDGNTAIGYGALSLSTNSRNSTMVGALAGRGLAGSSGNIYNDGFGVNSVGGYYYPASSNASNNVGIGYYALYKITGNANTAVGQNAGAYITTGNYNTIIGQYDGNAAPISVTGSNYIVLSDGQGNARGYFDPNGNFVIGTTTNPSGSNGLYVVGPITGFHVSTITSIATATTITPTITIGQYEVTALATAATIAAPSAGVDSQKLTIRIKDNGTARALTWTTTSGGYRALGVTLPTTTVVGKPVYIGCVYNAQDTFWDVLAVSG
jgi:hypothetical protein